MNNRKSDARLLVARSNPQRTGINLVSRSVIRLLLSFSFPTVQLRLPAGLMGRLQPNGDVLDVWTRSFRVVTES